MSASDVTIQKETIKIDPMLLFQRLITVQGHNQTDISQMFEFELSSIPAALFDSSGLMNTAVKSQLGKILWADRIQMHRMMVFITSLMAAHFCIYSNGLKDLVMNTFVKCMLHI